MELPTHLKNLYRHWDHHALPVQEPLLPEQVFDDIQYFNRMRWFIDERMNIWNKKTAGCVYPYTDDEVLSTYRFCNIFRELDRQTIVFHALLNPLRESFPLWLLNMFYCRMVARPETIQTTGLLSFEESENQGLYRKLIALPRPRFGAPYVFPVSTILKSDTPTREIFITDFLPRFMHEIADEITSWHKMPVSEGLEKIINIFGYQHRFLWTEVLIDTAYQFPECIDLFRQFPIGPGSLPTLQKIKAGADPSLLVAELSHLPVNTNLSFNGKPLRLSAENWEGIGCEFRKYTNLKEGKGRKRLYRER